MTRSSKSSNNDDSSKSDDSNLSGHDVQFDVFSRGDAAGTPNLSAFAAASATLGIDLQGLAPRDHASIKTGIRDVINLDAWGQGPISATSTATVNEQGNVVIVDNRLTGNAQTGITEDVTAYLPTSHVSIHLHVSDVFSLGLSGHGYTGATLAEASTSAIAIKLNTNSSPSIKHANTFDLAKFAAVVLGTTRWDINFAGSLPGESLQVAGHSVRTVYAEADILSSVPGSAVLRHLVFRDTDDTNFNFNNRTGAITTGHSGPHDIAPVAINTHYDGLAIG